MSIYISGSLAYDHIMDFPGYFKDHILPNKIHVLSVSFLLNKIEERFGGTAGNIAYNLSLLGEKSTILAAFGRDYKPYWAWLKSRKIDLSRIKINNRETTASAYIITDRADNQISGFYPGAMNKKNLFQLKKKPETEIACVAPGNKQEMLDLCKIYQRLKIPYIFDPGQQITSLSKRELQQAIKTAKILIANDYELDLLKHKTTWKNQQLLQFVKLIIITLGNKGSIIITKNKTYKIPITKPKKVVDPTGAGDAYRAGLVKGLLKNYPPEIIGRLAATTAVYAVEHYGTQKHYYTQTEFLARYNQNYPQQKFKLINFNC